MSDLVDKIEALYKSLLSLKQPMKQDQFVPAIKPPAMPKISAKPPSAVGKLPGALPPASKKDPRKIAEQLKNPRPGKVQVEVLKTAENGQWSLDKSDRDFQPTHLSATHIPDTHVPVSAGKKPTISSGELGTSPGRPTAKQRTVQNLEPVDSAKHGWGTEHHFPAQTHLIHGLKVHEAIPIRGNGLQGAKFAVSDSHPHTAVVKNSDDHEDREIRGHNKEGFNSARREVLYHNLARDFFGMGHHVPVTAGFTKNGSDWSAQKKVIGASHPRFIREDYDRQKIKDIEHPNHKKILRRLNDQGTLDKLSIMDHVMGHHDRHGNNVMLDDVGDMMHLIDNGTAFDYGNKDGHPVPIYRRAAQAEAIKGKNGHNSYKELHPEAKKWLMGLNPDKAARLLEQQGYGQDHDATRGMLKRLLGLQEKVKSKKFEHPDESMNGMFGLNRLE